ncbi:MAG: hypothetical protein MPK62_13575 [Alphaproteobacteria bacterium]|nr:hypothetical protein [Alphaproteobacteria bacterium]|tara:strand:+ start:327 stop:710 length:384 start_codon:yes stop_codon:yes gene_type:complete
MSGTQSYTFEKEYQKMLEDGTMLMGKMLGDQDAAAKELEEYHIKMSEILESGGFDEAIKYTLSEFTSWQFKDPAEDTLSFIFPGTQNTVSICKHWLRPENYEITFANVSCEFTSLDELEAYLRRRLS